VKISHAVIRYERRGSYKSSRLFRHWDDQVPWNKCELRRGLSAIISRLGSTISKSTTLEEVSWRCQNERGRYVGEQLTFEGKSMFEVGYLTGEIGAQSQLVLLARPDSRDVSKVRWSTIQSGILAEYFAPGFDRYFLSLESPKAWRGWASFDGNQLRAVRESGSTQLKDYGRSLEDGLFFYVPLPFALPRILGRIDTLLTSLRMHWPLAMDDLRKQLARPRIPARNARAHRNLWGAVVNGDVVLPDTSPEEIVAIVRQHRRRILRSAVKRARNGMIRSAAAYLPIAFSQVAVFRRDYRKRCLAGFRLGSDLVCTVRFHRMARIKSPDIMGSTVEVDGLWRIAWNRAWLEETGVSLG
jgi:hypothetical protein